MRLEIQESLDRYAQHGVETGGFLRAVLSNDLKEACLRADEENQEALYQIVKYIWNHLPAACWGSPAKVEAWLTNHQKRRELKQRESRG
jgi:hypothetical protein